MEDWIIISLEEYKTLRTESIESMKNQHNSIQIGTALVAALLSVGFSLWNKSYALPEIIFIFFTPIFSYLVLMRWLGELGRMMRAGQYISTIEKK